MTDTRQPASLPRLSDDVADRIRRFVIDEGLEEGSRLPSERDLALRFGASRPTVSQALRSLSLIGLVEIRRGSGAYVLRRPESMVTASVNLMLDLDGRTLDHLMDLRLWLETLGVREAAAREPHLSAAEVSGILGVLNRLRNATGGVSEWIAADTVFHATIVRSSGNPYLAAIYESVHTAVLTYELKQWVDLESVPRWLQESGPEQLWALHEPIATAVLGRDADAAEAGVLAHHEALLEHLREARESVQTG